MVKKILLFLIILALNGCQQDTNDQLIYDQLVKTEKTGFYHVPIGLCEDYPEETTTLETIRSDFELLKRTGVKFLRISFGWDAIESQKDQYDWLFWDDFVKMAVEEYNITLIPYICYTPRWVSTAPAEDSLQFWNHPPKDYDQFGEFIYDLVSRYKKWIKSWELWNEPDIRIYWKGTTADFARFTKIGSKAVRRADPDALVVLGGLAHRPEFTRELFQNHDISPHVDIVNIHNYYETWHPAPVERVVEYVDEISDIVEQYGNGQDIWMAEVGYSTFKRKTYVSEVYNACYHYEHTPEYQAVDLFKRLSLVISTKKISAIAWYEIKDLPASEEVIGDEYNNRYLGVAYEDHSPKPAEKALVHFRTLFSRPYRVVTENIRVQKSADSDSRLVGFVRSDSSMIVIAWLQTNVPEDRPLQPQELVNDERTEEITVTLPVRLDGGAMLYNAVGEKKSLQDLQHGDNSTSFKLVLKGGKIGIAELLR
ncbi:cellulase family glycosylhydrolase [candidate division KSB1 bacterium]|nr:cellulase family glycosylhydrolase [candidate division KSB1 bacterium]